jgi:hypothetical protein
MQKIPILSLGLLGTKQGSGLKAKPPQVNTSGGTDFRKIFYNHQGSGSSPPNEKNSRRNSKKIFLPLNKISKEN